MGIQGWAVLVLAVLVAVASPVALGVWWVRQRRRPRSATGRGSSAAVALTGIGVVVLVVVGQVGAIGTVGLIANKQYDFYSSWSDLFGTGAGAANIKQIGNGANPAPSATGAGQRVGADPSRVGGAAHGAHRRLPGAILAKSRYVPGWGKLTASPFTLPAGQGRVLTAAFGGQRSGISANQDLVWLPPQYDQPAYRHTRFPVIEVLPGYPGHPQSWVQRLKLPAMALAAQRQDGLPPFIAVIANITAAPPRDTECANVVAGPRVDTFLGTDVPNDVQHLLRTTTPAGHWATMGDSTGGFCAVKLALEHPGTFGTAISFAGYFHALEDWTTGDLYGHSVSIREHNSPVWLLSHGHHPNVHIIATASNGDRDTVTQLHRLITAAHPPVRVSGLISASGGHNFNTWIAQFPSVMRQLTPDLPPISPAP